MSRAAEVRLEFGGEERLFRLPVGRLRALQEKTDCGPFELYSRLGSGTWRIDDLREPILQGLIGGGADVSVASRLMTQHFDDLPKLQFVQLAQAVLAVVLMGVEDEPEGERKAGAEKPKRRSRVTKSDSGQFTKAPPP